MNTQIIDFEQSVKNSFENEFYTLINNIKCNLSIKNIQLLNYFNSNFQTLINELKEVNNLLQKDPNEEIVDGNEYIVGQITIRSGSLERVTMNIQGKTYSDIPHENTWTEENMIFHLSLNNLGH